MDHAGRRVRLIARLPELGADAFLVTRLPNVRYLTGFSGSNAQLLLAAGTGLFLTDGRYEEQSRREVSELDREIYVGEFPPVFADACRRLGMQRVAFESAALTVKSHGQLAATGVELVPTDGEIERFRWTKERAEIERLEAAQDIADRAFEEFVAGLRMGVTEQEAALELDTTMRRLGADGLAFDTIVAFGESAAEPHHHPTDRPLKIGDVVKVDFGCVVRGYHSDMTRTVFFGDPPETLREVYQVVRRAQQAGVDALRPGIRGGDADRAAREVIAEAGYGDRFGHGLGHGVGLEIHEGPGLRRDGGDVIPVGAIVTVEPGVYLPGVGGVRIEDMVEVTEAGARVIPRTPKDPIVIES